MSSGITLSAGVRQNLLSLQATADMMATTQNRLATGKKVNTALDNPSSFFTSQSLSDRAGDLNALLDSIGQATKTLDAASNGITSLTKLVQSAQATARQALQAPNAYTSRASVTSSGSGIKATDLSAIMTGSGVSASTGVGSKAIDTTSIPDKVATEVFNTVAADTAGVATGSDLGTFDGNSAINTFSSAFAAGDQITVGGANGTYTLNVTTATTGADDANNIQENATTTTLASKLQALLRTATGDNSATVAFSDANDNFVFTMNDNTKDFTVGGNSSKMGVTAQTYKPTNGTLTGGYTVAQLAGVDMSTGGATGATLMNAAAIDTANAAPSAGNTITITGANGTQVLTFTASGTASGANQVNVDDSINTGVGKLQNLLRQATGDYNATVSFVDGTDSITMKLSDAGKSFTIASTSTALLGLADGTYTNGGTDGGENLVSNARTMTLQVGSGASKTLYFGTGDGKIQNRRDLVAQLNTVSGLSASLSGNVVTLKNAASDDYRSDITVTANNSSILTRFGIGAGASSTLAATTSEGTITVDAANKVATISATNLLTQVSGLNGQSLTIGVGTASKTLTFGTGATQVATYAELQAAIGNEGGVLSKDAGNRLAIATNEANVAKTLQISGNATATLGINNGTFNGSGQSLSGTSLTISIGSGTSLRTSNFTFGSASGQINTLDDLNSKLTADSMKLTASLDTTGKLKFETTNENARETFSMNGTAANRGFGASNAFEQLDSSAPVFGGAGDTQRRNLVSDFNNVISQIDTLAGDSSYNGVNLLGGDDLQVIFNENNTSKLAIKGVKFDATGLGLTSLTSDGSDFLDSSSINAVLSKLDTATRSLRSQASKFGSNLTTVQTRQDFTKSMINTLQTGGDELILADTNVEGANMLALQTRQQLSTTALSLANQANQAVLRLF